MKTRRRRLPNINALFGALPMFATAIGLYVIGIAYSAGLSFTNSKLLPRFDKFVGFANYDRLWDTSRWIISVQNIWIFGSLMLLFTFVFGFLLAIFMDQKIRQEDTLRTIFLYPYALSLVVTGVVWKWMMDPTLGIQQQVRNWGWESFHFAPLVDSDTAIYGLVVSAVWQSTGVTMAILLAGLRGIDSDIWKAIRVEGIPQWRAYIHIIIPMMKGAVGTVFVIQCVGIVRIYDLIVAQTDGGPGISTEMPAKFVIDHITDRLNVSLAMAGAMIMLLPILFLIAVRGILIWRKNVALKREAQA